MNEYFFSIICILKFVGICWCYIIYRFLGINILLIIYNVFCMYMYRGLFELYFVY